MFVYCLISIFISRDEMLSINHNIKLYQKWMHAYNGNNMKLGQT